MINLTAVIVAGLAGAVVFSIFTAMARAMGMTEMSIEKTLGLMFGKGNGAQAMGWVMHLIAGVIFALIYAYIFVAVGATNGWFFGGVIGLFHGVVVGAMVMPMMGIIHPAVKAGEMKAPGFFAVNAGPMTPMGLVVGHIVFGVVLGGVYFLLA